MARRGAAAKVQMQQQVVEPMEQETRKRPWEKVDADGNKIKRKKVPGAKNIRIRKHVQPRNALSCINELCPGAVFGVQQEGGVGQQYGISVTVNGESFTGYGSSKQVAKQNAAEAALVSFVKPPVPKSAPGEENEDSEDKTPWATLAAFAMYKLFSDWKDGRIGVQSGGAAPLPQTPAFDLRNTLSRSVGGVVANNEAVMQHLGTPTALGGKTPAATPAGMQPAKQLPDNAAQLHPVMILHQMRPGVTYTTNKTTGEDNKVYFYVSINVDGQEFTGEGPNLKKAKFHLARDAMYGLFGVESTFEQPA